MINWNECKFGDKLKMSNGEMGLYAGWYNPFVNCNNGGDTPKYIPSKEKLHNIIVPNGTSFGIVQVYDNGSLHGGIYVVGKWEE